MIKIGVIKLEEENSKNSIILNLNYRFVPEDGVVASVWSLGVSPILQVLSSIGHSVTPPKQRASIKKKTLITNFSS